MTAALLMLGVACSGDRPLVEPPPTTGASPDQLPVTVVDLPPVPPVLAVGSIAADDDPSTFYVDPNDGNDQSSGQSSVEAWASLQLSMDKLEPGETLFLMTGEYRDQVKAGQSHFHLAASGRADAWIRLTAAPGHSPVIVADAGNGIEIAGNYVEVSHLRVRGQSFGPGNDYGWGILTRNNHHVRVVGNEISGMAVGGITSVEATNLDFVGNTVYENSFWGPEQGSGISLWRSRDAGTEAGADGYHDRITRNVVYRNENKVPSEALGGTTITDGNGIIIDGTTDFDYRGRILVANNVVFDNGGRGVLVLNSSKVDVVHNTTFHNGRTDGLEGGPTELAVGNSSQVLLLNNLAWSRTGAPAVIVDRSHEVTSGGNALVTDTPTEAHSDADLLARSDPGLVAPSADPSTTDFRPLPDSQIIGRAVPFGPAVPLDIDGVPRPLQGADPGAYEHLAE